MITDINEKITAYKAFTESYQKYYNNKGLREVECLRIQYRLWMRDIAKGDIFVGKGEFDHAIGFSAQPFCDKYDFFLHEEKAREELQHPELTAQNKKIFEELINYWSAEETLVKTRADYPPAMQKALPSDNWTGEAGIAFPLYRMSGTQLDYDKLLILGINGLRAEIIAHKQRVTCETEQWNLYCNMEKALDLFSEVCLYYQTIAAEQINATGNQPWQQELSEIACILEKIAVLPPDTMREAMQLSYLYCQFSGSINYGRIDEYLGDFLENDLQNGILTQETAIELIAEYWKTINWRNRMYDSRLTIGGRGRRNETHADRFALLAIEAMRRVKTTTPQISLRFYDGQNPEIMDKALETIGEGTTYPMLYNDDVNIGAVEHAFCVPYSEARQYIPYGCGEYTIYHKSVGTPSGVINLLQALIVTLHNGIDPVTGKTAGIKNQNNAVFNTFDELLTAYKKQVEYFVEQLAYQEALEYKVAAETSPHLYFSILYDDCIARGKPVFDGGVRYLGGTLEAYGNSNTADSLTAINKLVFKEKKISLTKLKQMLAANFNGYEKERKWLLQAPKYGNDHPEADRMKVEIDRHICTVTRNMAPKAGLHSYLIVIINNDANTTMGKHTTASPDGRKNGVFLANGNNPVGGMDKNGITAMLNSLVKPDVNLHAGAVQNMKFSSAMFSTYRKQLEALLNTYFKNGGAQAMITVLNRNDLENAMQEPQKYQNLIVRVGGFSARFVELPKDVQKELLSRTLYE